MKTFDQFKNDYLGLRIGDEILVATREETEDTKYQCVSMVKQYMLETKGIICNYPGNAINFWTQTRQEILTGFDQISNSSAQKGDIVILWGVNGNKYGHIGVATGNVNPTQIEILEQNGSTGNGRGEGDDVIRTRYVDRSRVAGLLRPKLSQPVEMWTLDSSFTPKQVKTNKNPTHKWGLNWEFDYMSQHPVAERPQGDVFLAVAKVIHVSGHHYYRDNIDDANGYEVADCDDYTPPKTTPAAPDKGKLAIKYDVVAVIKQYPSYEDALRDTAATGTTKKKTYYQREQKGSFYCLADDNMTNDTFWIDGKDNLITPEESKVPPRITEVVTAAAEQLPKPTAEEIEAKHPILNPNWRVTQSIEPDNRIIWYQAMNTVPITIYDLENPKESFVMQPYNQDENGQPRNIPARKYFYKEDETGKLNQYIRPVLVEKAMKFYSVDTTYLERLPEPKSAIQKRLDENHDGRLDISDFREGIQDFIDYGNKIYKYSVSAVHNIGKTDKAVQATAKVHKFGKGVIDGFTRRKTK